MSRTRSLANFIADCRQRANMENSTFVTDAEITEYLNQELAELWGRLVLGQGQPFFRTVQTISVIIGTALYPLASDFFQLQEVNATIGGITGVVLPFMPVEHGWLTNGAAWGPYAPVKYRIQANNIEFVPATQNFAATLYYTPSQPRLVSLSDTFDGFNGFEMAAIYGTVAQMLAKEESDPSFFVGQKDRILQHIDKLSAQRDAANPERVQDTETSTIWPRTLLGWWN